MLRIHNISDVIFNTIETIYKKANSKVMINGVVNRRSKPRSDSGKDDRYCPYFARSFSKTSLQRNKDTGVLAVCMRVKSLRCANDIDLTTADEGEKNENANRLNEHNRKYWKGIDLDTTKVMTMGRTRNLYVEFDGA